VAGRGPAPKGARARDRDTPEFERIANNGKLHGDPLPEDVLGDETWHPRTVAWWKTWRESPLAQNFTGTDWDFLLDTALMHHTMWSKGKWEFAAELRLRAAKFGATPEDRMRLKIKIETPASPPTQPVTKAGKVTDISSRRARLTE
jgi:hypothetical protein